jgi:hypothetical protein
MTPNASIVTDASPPRYAAGAVIGNKYVLEGPLGEGGMGTVWRARNVLLGSPVALKLLQLSNQDSVDRLLREARIEATLLHPGIVRVFDFERTESGDFFIVMELLEGQTLAELLEQRGKIESAEAVRLVLPVVDALCTAHANGVVHRDLKEVDHRVDLWGICLVLYEAVSGRTAFDGSSPDAVLRAVVEDEVAPFEEASIEQAELWPIVARGLAKAPALRFDSMLELGTVLAHWLLTHGTIDDRSEGEVARSWLRAHALSDRMYGPKRARELAESPSLHSDVQPIATSVAAALSTTEVHGAGGWNPFDEPRCGGRYALPRRPLFAAVLAR